MGPVTWAIIAPALLAVTFYLLGTFVGYQIAKNPKPLSQKEVTKIIKEMEKRDEQTSK
jgi:hypothetical protein